jgi:YD repeat-containing protein
MRPFALARILVAMLLLGFASHATLAQNSEIGFRFFGSYDGTATDTVNLMNGNLTLHIPLPFYYAQRGSKIDPRYFLVANSKNWFVQMTDPANTGAVYSWSYGGTTGHMPPGSNVYIASPITGLLLTRTYITTLSTDGSTPPSGEAGPPSLSTWDGGGHSFTVGGVSMDTTGYQLTMSNPDQYGVPQTATVTDRHGNVYQGNFGDAGGCTRVTENGADGSPVTITCQQAATPGPTDSNGNEYGLTDTLGRNVISGAGVGTTNTSGCVSSLPIASATTFSYTGPTGTAETIELCFGTLTYQTEFTQPGIKQVQDSAGPKTGPVVVTMILNDGTKYTFNWDSYGSVTSIGLPTGGSITYGWTQISMPFCSSATTTQVSRAIASRTVFDGTTSRTWNYTYGTQQSNGSISNTVTDPLGNSTVHSFTAILSSCSLYETSTMTYQGSSTSGQLLETVNTTYTGTGSGLTAFNFVPTSIQTTIGNSVKLVTKTYDTGLGSGQPIFADVVTEQEYDWGAGSHGALLRQTNTSYLWQTNSSYLTAGLLELPSSVVVENAAGTRVAETDYTYDEATSYNNAQGQKVNPTTGQTVSNSDPSAHIPLKAAPQH